jgi:hypothetical protein
MTDVENGDPAFIEMDSKENARLLLGPVIGNITNDNEIIMDDVVVVKKKQKLKKKKKNTMSQLPEENNKSIDAPASTLSFKATTTTTTTKKKKKKIVTATTTVDDDAISTAMVLGNIANENEIIVDEFETHKCDEQNQLGKLKKYDVVIGGSIGVPSEIQKEENVFNSGLDLESGDNTISSTDEERNSVEKQGGKFCEFIFLSNLCLFVCV